MAFSAEFDRYPLTGRFLAGRLRHELTDAEKTELEQLVVRTSTLEDGERLIARGDACEWSTILIDGFVLRTLDSGERRYAVSFHVPGDFVDLRRPGHDRPGSAFGDHTGDGRTAASRTPVLVLHPPRCGDAPRMDHEA